MKVFVLSILAVVCLAEPPVDNKYLPPQQKEEARPLSTLYRAPVQKQTDALFGRPPTFNRITNEYGPPKLSTYIPPAPRYEPPQRQLPSRQYGVPSTTSSQYGAPGSSDVFSQGKFRSQEQNREYLPPGAGARKAYRDDEGNGEPVNYSFEYMVMDEQSGNDFGHRESRQGERAEGLYYVLLPDGRKQTVEYEADEDGYKPRITYEETGLVRDGYGKNSQSDIHGY